MENITPGTLCLVTTGRNVGKSCVAERVVSALDVQEAVLRATHLISRIVEYENDPIWAVSESMSWGPRKDPTAVWCEVPFMRQSQLLPIPPLADPISTTQKEEKPCTV